MNELLEALLAEANHLGCNGTALDDKLSDSLRRIVQQTRANIACREREYWRNKYQEMYPLISKELTAAELLKIHGGIPMDNKPNT